MFDVLTIAAIADELSATILDGRVQQAGLITARSFGLEIYAGGRRHHLVASAESDDAKLLLTPNPPVIDRQRITPFLLLLRKYVRGGIVVGIEQPPLERVIRLSIAKGLGRHNEPDEEDVPTGWTDRLDEDELVEGIADAEFVHIAVELMGRQSNLILVDDGGRVMESVKRVTTRMSRVRPVAPKLPYTEPPVPVERLDPRRVTAEIVQQMLAGASGNDRVAALLSRSMRAMSPQMSREVVFRVTGSSDTSVALIGSEGASALARETRRLLEPLLTGAWVPTVYRGPEGEAVAFAAVPMEHLAAELQEERAASMSAAAAVVVEPPAVESPSRHAARRDRLLRAIESAASRVEARLSSLREQEAMANEAEHWRRYGELIYAYLWQIQPGQRVLEVEGEIVPLDPTKPAKEVAQDYFERYRKAQAATGQVQPLIQSTEIERDYLAQLATIARQATAFQDIEAVAAEFDSHERTRAGTSNRAPFKRSAPKKRPRPLFDQTGNAIYVGRSGTENDTIAFDLAGPDDTWLHARGVPGSHVVIRWNGRAAIDDPRAIATAAALAAYYSASRGSASVEVDHTRRRHVRKIKGAGPGMVTYRNEQTVRVTPASETELGLSADAG